MSTIRSMARTQFLNTELAEAFGRRSVASALTIRGDRVLMMSAVAQATSPSLGQASNVAVEDAAIFDKLLDECDLK